MAGLRNIKRPSREQTGQRAVFYSGKHTAMQKNNICPRFSNYKGFTLHRVPSVDDHAMLEDDEDMSPTMSELEALGDPETDIDDDDDEEEEEEEEEEEDDLDHHSSLKDPCADGDTLKSSAILTRKPISSLSDSCREEDGLSQAWSFMTTYERVDWDRPELLQAERPRPTRVQQIREFARRAVRKLKEMKRQPCRDDRGFKGLGSPQLEGRVGA